MVKSLLVQHYEEFDSRYKGLLRAALSGTTLCEIVRRLIQQGLRHPSVPPGSGAGRPQPPPVIIPPAGTPIPALPRARVQRLEQEEDEARHA